MGYIIGMTCNDIYIYCPKYYRISGKYTYHTKFPQLIVNTINFRYCMVTVTNSRSILVATILAT